jgi:hypothetical protein
VSLLNNKADHYASLAQNATQVLPTTPILTFYMDQFVFYHDLDSWIELNICVFVDYFLARQTATKLSLGHHFQMSTWLYDLRPHPVQPYTRAYLGLWHTQHLYSCVLVLANYQLHQT